MSRQKRILQKRFVVFCEGDTEYNYIDKMRKKQGELESFRRLLDYCRIQNKKGNTPHFIIMNNPNFEYVACLHSPKYKGQNPQTYIQKELGVKNITDFKKNADIYNFLNNAGLSYEFMLSAIRGKDKFVSNEYEIKKKKFEIIVKNTRINMECMSKKCSNIEEFFDIIDW